MASMRNRERCGVGMLVGMLVLCAPAAAAGSEVPAVVSQRATESAAMAAAEHPHWQWPLDGAREVLTPYRAPTHAYGPGHRGVDLAAAQGTIVHAPAGGVVAFRGTVVDRPLLTIEHPGGYVSTFEPLESALSPGDVVAEGDVIGTVASGGHSAVGTMHLGVRLAGAYINPMLLFGEVPRAVLLPCCAPL